MYYNSKFTMNLDTIDTATFIKTINDSSFTKKDYDLLKKQVDTKIKKYNEDMIEIGNKLNELNNERDLLISKLQKIYLQSKIVSEIKKDEDENLEVINNVEEVIIKKPTKTKKSKNTADETLEIKTIDNNEKTLIEAENLNIKDEVKEEPIKKTKTKKETPVVVEKEEVKNEEKITKNVEEPIKQTKSKTKTKKETIINAENLEVKNISATDEKIIKNDEIPIKQLKTKTKKEK